MTAKTPIRVATVDAQPIFRTGLRQIFAAHPDIAVVGEAGSSVDAFTLCERLRPDLLLFDATLPGGLTLIAQLAERGGGPRVLILTERLDEGLLSTGLQLGIAGYLLKQIDTFDFVQAVRSAAGGLLVLAPEASNSALGQGGWPHGHPDLLSSREQMVLDLLLGGLSNRAIAAQLNLSCATVKFHLRNVYEKLGVRTRGETMALFSGRRPEPVEHEQLPIRLARGGGELARILGGTVRRTALPG